MTVAGAEQRVPAASRPTEVTVPAEETCSPGEPEETWLAKLATIRPDLSGPHAERLLQSLEAQRPARRSRGILANESPGAGCRKSEIDLRDDLRSATGQPLVPTEEVEAGVVPYSAAVSLESYKIDETNYNSEANSILIPPGGSSILNAPPLDNPLQPGTYGLPAKRWGIVLTPERYKSLLGQELAVRVESHFGRGSISVLELAPPGLGAREGNVVRAPPRPFPRDPSIDRLWMSALAAWDRAHARFARAADCPLRGSSPCVSGSVRSTRVTWRNGTRRGTRCDRPMAR
ncbi:MAG: hypothetical protein R3B96_14765 [Pirellulaceae bacterium]